MNREELIETKKQLMLEREAATKAVDEKWTAVLDKYHEENVPYKVGQVVDVVKAKKYKRMVIYHIRTQFWSNVDLCMTMLHGWYLDKDNVPCKWEGNGLAVLGVSNPTEIRLSDNQTNLPVPKQLLNQSI